jgi:hypothetical protein
MVCSKCKKTLRYLDNYGTTGNRLCYKCANESICSICGNKVEINNQYNDNSKLYCYACYKNYDKTLIDNISDNMTTFKTFGSVIFSV